MKNKMRCIVILFILIVIGIVIVYCIKRIQIAQYEINRRDIYTEKPIIYLYPEKNTIINVSLGKPENITCSYPEYKDSWEVLADSNGNLLDVSTGREYYGLYWEGKSDNKDMPIDGFVIKSENTVSFLEEKLEILGLSQREANEFIIYWLPKLSQNPYNLIRFQNIEEINSNMPLTITPKPDTIIRVMMEYVPLENPIEITEQHLYSPDRTGYTVVEWGGREITDVNIR